MKNLLQVTGKNNIESFSTKVFINRTTTKEAKAFSSLKTWVRIRKQMSVTIFNTFYLNDCYTEKRRSL